MPLRHVALLRWAEHVDDAHIDRVREAFDDLAESAAGVQRFTHGVDVGVSDESYDYVVVADFESVVEWRAFRESTAYVLLDAELLAGHVVERAGGQFHMEDHRGVHDVSSAGMQTLLAEPDDVDLAAGLPSAAEETDDELMERARRAAMASMESLMSEPDEITPPR